MDRLKSFLGSFLDKHKRNRPSNPERPIPSTAAGPPVEHSRQLVVLSQVNPPQLSIKLAQASVNLLSSCSFDLNPTV